jgi:23S rRNA pseudouridine1911/1915/1917 synthase
MAHAADLERRLLVWPEQAKACPIDRVLRESLAGASWAFCRRLVATGKVRIAGVTVLDPRTVVLPNAEVEINPRAARPGRRDADQVRLVHYDAQIVVADKPSGISTVAFDANERGTFDELVRRALGSHCNQRLPPLGIVHRIDKETSGLVVFARTTTAKRHLKQQFRFHTNHRAYLALATGYVESRTIRSRLVADRGDGRRGSTEHASLGQLATTHIEVVERFSSATLVRCRLETGRTHQIRIHLAEAGHPLLGERVYGKRADTTSPCVSRLMLHAAELGITHPTREIRLDFVSDLPDAFLREIARLRNVAQP